MLFMSADIVSRGTMKVLWLCNTPLPQLANKIGIHNYNEGWLIGISNQLQKQKDVELTVLCPQNHINSDRQYKINGIRFIAFFKENLNNTKPDLKMERKFKLIIEKIDPDVIHIFGTEYSHTLEMMRVAQNRKTIISIQGLISECAKYYSVGIPWHECIRPYIYQGELTSIYKEKNKFRKRGKSEMQALKLAKYVIGRTKWDHSQIMRINNQLRYFHCNETMRDTFYHNHWNIKEINRYEIFVSQAYYSLKGVHCLIKALPIIKKRYPEVKVIVGGSADFINGRTKSPYGKYLDKLMRKLEVKDHINFIGSQTETNVCNHLLQAHVFVSTSSIENSSNSIAEAMLIGTPVVASDVGGTSSLLKHKKEGYLFRSNSPDMLAHYVCKVFNDDMIADSISFNEQNKAKIMYAQQANALKLMKIYRYLGNKRR